jgi:hypothetical protein
MVSVIGIIIALLFVGWTIAEFELKSKIAIVIIFMVCVPFFVGITAHIADFSNLL